jgi:hypothetical protein
VVIAQLVMGSMKSSCWSDSLRSRFEGVCVQLWPPSWLASMVFPSQTKKSWDVGRL